jgi:hypothetical protein
MKEKKKRYYKDVTIKLEIDSLDKELASEVAQDVIRRINEVTLKAAENKQINIRSIRSSIFPNDYE